MTRYRSPHRVAPRRTPSGYTCFRKRRVRWPSRPQIIAWSVLDLPAVLLAPYFEGFGRFYGDASGLQQSYWALVCWLYAAPFAPALRTAALRHDGSPLAYPVHAVLYGRSDGGKTMFSRVISRSMFGLEQMVRGKDFTTQRALGAIALPCMSRIS